MPFYPFDGCGAMVRTSGEVDAVTKFYDLLLWMVPKLDKFPRNQKYLIGERIETLLLDILELLLEAAYSRNKVAALRQANLKLEKLRYLVRLSKDLKLINMQAYEQAARRIDEVGRSVGGWLRYTRREDLEKPVPADRFLRQSAPGRETCAVRKTLQDGDGAIQPEP